MHGTKVYENLSTVLKRQAAEGALHKSIPIRNARDVGPLAQVGWAGNTRSRLGIIHQSPNVTVIRAVAAHDTMRSGDPKIARSRIYHCKTRPMEYLVEFKKTVKMPRLKAGLVGHRRNGQMESWRDEFDGILERSLKLAGWRV